VLSASKVSTSAMMTGTYTWSKVMPPSDLSGLPKAGMLPKMTSSSRGNATAQNSAAFSRRNSRNSVTASLRNAGPAARPGLAVTTADMTEVPPG
jgi:hypothetical protein